MNKDNVNKSAKDIFCETQKELEKSCLITASNKIPWLQEFELIEDEQQESPDLILEKNNKSIGIEHFYVDLLYLNKKKHKSLGRYTFAEIRKLYKSYHLKAKNHSFELKDGKDASKVLEGILNELIDCQNEFNYNLFIRELNRNFNNHYSKRHEYLKNRNLEKLGFLIEIRRYFKSSYICKKNNGITKVDSTSVPITKGIVECLNKYGDGLDFIIIVVKGLLDDYERVEYYDIKKPAKPGYDSFEIEKISRKIQISVEE